MHLVQVIILQGIVLFQSLKFYDDEIPCKQNNLLDTDLLVSDVIDDFELSVTVVNACVYYIFGYILSNFKQFTDLVQMSYLCRSGCLELEAIWVILSIW